MASKLKLARQVAAAATGALSLVGAKVIADNLQGPAPTQTWAPTASAVQRPAVQWAGGVQHNANNPEVIDQSGRTYSSRAFAPQGVGFVKDGKASAQQVFSSNKNMSGDELAQSVVITNPGSRPLSLKVSMRVTDPGTVPPTLKTVSVPAGGSVRVPAAKAKDTGFVAFNATIEPADTASASGAIHVDVVAHSPGSRTTAAQLAKQPLMQTEGERGYRIPVDRLGENPAYLKEVRFVMKAAGVTPDPLTQTDAQVKKWATNQATQGANGQANAFDPAHNRGILGRVNGLVSTSEGQVTAQPLTVSQPGASSLVRIRPNAEPPQLIGGRSGASSRDVGAYGKPITTTVPLRNDSGKPIRVAVRLATTPEGQDGAQIKGHQSYNGSVLVTADGGTLSDVRTSLKLVQPGARQTAPGSAQVAKFTVPAQGTVTLRVRVETHANSQFPLDLSVTRVSASD